MTTQEESQIVREVFVKHPPRTVIQPDAQLNLFVTESAIIDADPDAEYWPALLHRDKQFKESGNPVHAIESFILCHRAGLYPPLGILDWLADALEEWHKKQGALEMDRAMGLKKPGKSGNAMRNAIIEQFEETLMIEIHKLRLMFDLTIRDAAYIVSVQLEDNPATSRGPALIPRYAHATLIDKFEKKWSRMFRRDDKPAIGGGPILSEHFGKLSDDKKRKFLARYPRHAYAHLPKLQKYL